MRAIITRVVLILLVAAGAFASGYFYREPEVQVQTQIKEVEKVVTKTVTVRDQAADGTVTEKTTTETVTEQANDTTADVVQTPSTKPNFVISKPDWSLELRWNPAAVFDPDKPNYYPQSAHVGRRLFWNAWGIAGYDWQHKEVQVGFRYDF